MRERSLLDLDDLTSDEISYLMQRATAFHANPPGRDLLRGVTVVNLFFEPSTRTYTSFAIAEARVGADVVALPTGSSSLGKGETIEDTALTLAAMGVKVIVTRHPESGFPYRLADSFAGHVINAGDVSHSRVAPSTVSGLRRLGADVTLIGPPTLVPDAMAGDGVHVARDLDAILPQMDVVMLLRIQRERIAAAVLATLDDYGRSYQLDARRLGSLASHAIVMHPGPYNRGVELTDDGLGYGGGAPCATGLA